MLPDLTRFIVGFDLFLFFIFFRLIVAKSRTIWLSLLNLEYILTTICYIMVVKQDCIYERTMTVTYERNGDNLYYDEFNDIKETINRELYEKGYPLVSTYSLQAFDELDEDDYYPRVNKRKEEHFFVKTIAKDDGETYTLSENHWKDDAQSVITAVKFYATCNNLPVPVLELETKVTETESTSRPSCSYRNLVPYIFTTDNYETSKLDDLLYDIVTRNVAYSQDTVIRISEDIDEESNENNYSTVKTTLEIGKLHTTLTFSVQWEAPVKSTKANIEHHLVTLPELLTAKVMNVVEAILKDNWDLDEDSTTIDCVTQSNINTQAECSPAVISSLRKTKAEL
tara:strand:+ start:3101 stop:4120 length:1020 start_codon:yes stop_codon:yes gene_type:complete